MASTPPLHRPTHHHHLHPSLLPAIPFRPSCCCCCCCCVRRILLHHHFHHQLFHRQALPSWPAHGSPPSLVPRPGVCPPPTLSYREDQCGFTAPEGQGAVEAGDPSITSGDISSNRLQEETRAEEFGDELGGGGEDEEEEAVYVLTDEWAEFFAKSEAKRQLERKQKKKKQQKGRT